MSRLNSLYEKLAAVEAANAFTAKDKATALMRSVIAELEQLDKRLSNVEKVRGL